VTVKGEGNGPIDALMAGLRNESTRSPPDPRPRPSPTSRPKGWTEPPGGAWV
jgi:hypothetical protein